jgi:sec-independent protein translocase protein TatC
LLVILQRPLNETLYYTTPAGAFSFIIKICTVFGLIVALPVVIYHGFSFFEPLIKARTKRLLLWYVVVSVALAAAGIAFAYFVSLPAALHFLVNFGGGEIESLITANEYFNFVLAYLAGFALLFELPLVLMFINRIKPLMPSTLLGGTRYVVLGSFIAAAIITPTPDPLNQLLMAGPVILLYFFSACLVVFMNSLRGSRAAVTMPAQSNTSFQFDRSQVALKPSAPAAPTPSAVMQIAHQNRPNVRPAKRLASDMVVRRAAPKLSYQRRPVPEPRRQNVRPRLISDFLPASD